MPGKGTVKISQRRASVLKDLVILLEDNIMLSQTNTVRRRMYNPFKLKIKSKNDLQSYSSK